MKYKDAERQVLTYLAKSKEINIDDVKEFPTYLRVTLVTDRLDLDLTIQVELSIHHSIKRKLLFLTVGVSEFPINLESLIRSRLTYLLENLIVNAIRYCDDDSIEIINKPNAPG